MSRTDTRQRILAATVRTLAELGFARTTARSIAKSGGFAPGVIYYHFADLDDLFVATAEFTSDDRFTRYAAALHDVTSAADTVRLLRELYAEDDGSGHIAAVQELMAAATAGSRLAEQVRIETARWQQLAERTLERLLDGSPFAAFVPVRELATGAVAMYLGIELLAHLQAQGTGPDALFDAAERAATMIDALRAS